MSQTDSPDILFYPPLSAATAIAAAIALEWLAPIRILPAAFAGWSVGLGLILIVIALGIALSGVRAFKSAGTNITPHKPALNLVETGPYRFTRNPMYLGIVLLQPGLAFAFSLDWALLIAPILWVALHVGVVLREESYLSAKFGQPYLDFLARTRRWF